MLRPARRVKVYTTSPTDADGLKLSVATSLTAVTYSAATLDGALANPGPAAIDLPMNVSVTTTTDAATYNTTDPIVVTGTNFYGEVITESLLLTEAGGNETIVGTKGFATVVSIAVPAQLTTDGAFTFGVLDTVLDTMDGAAQRVTNGHATVAGNVAIVDDGGKASTVPLNAASSLDAYVQKIVWASTTALPLVVSV